MVEIVNVSAVSATMAAWAADAAKQPTVVGGAIAAREARKLQLRQERDDVTEDDVESASPVIQTATAGLDLMNDGHHHPQTTLTQALRFYAENE